MAFGGFAMIDLTCGEPTTGARIECPLCEAVIPIYDLTIGETYEEEFDCPDCERPIKVVIEVEIEFRISAKTGETT